MEEARPSKPATRLARFGAFELDLRSGELRKLGIRIRLQLQPFVVLSTLLERPGELVEREELRQRLWPDGRFVDYEDGLTTAVKKVRRALSDSSASPRYIETLPKRGYRFTAPVEFVEVAPPQKASEPGPLQERPPKLQAAYALAAVVTAALFLTFRLQNETRVVPYEAIPLTQDPGLTADPSVSDDGNWLAYASDRDGGGDLDIWVQPFPLPEGEAPRQVTKGADHEFHPELAPDGSAVVYSKGEGRSPEVILRSLEGDSERRLGRGDYARFSPDGRHVSFVEFGLGLIHVAPVDGGQLRRIAPDFFMARAHDWLPDSRRIIFVGKETADSPWSFWIAPIGGGPVVDTGFSTHEELETAQITGLRWIAEAHELIFTYEPTRDIRRVGLDRATERFNGRFQAIPAPRPMGAQYPSLTNRGLVFGARTTSNDVRALVLDPSTGRHGALERVTDSPAEIQFAGVAHDGRKIVAGSKNENGRMQWKVMELTNHKDTVICPEVNVGRGRVPKISPDGKLVACIGAENMEGSLFEVRQLWLASAEGGPSRKLCTECGYPASWMPDSQGLLTVLIHRPNNLYRVSLVTVDGDETILLEGIGQRFDYPLVSPDRSWLYFRSHDPNDHVNGGFYAAPFRTDRKIRREEWIQIANLPFEAPALSDDGRTLYFLSRRDGSLCIWAQELSTATGGPEGEPFAVYHSHNFRSSIRLGRRFDVQMAVAGQRLFFPWGISSGNVWMYENFQLD